MKSFSGISSQTSTIDSLVADIVTIDVKKYGAKGDGITDDSGVIKSIVSSLNSSAGGTIFFPTGTYVFSTQILIQNINNIRIRTEKGVVLKKQAKFPTDMPYGIFEFLDCTGVHVDEVIFEGITTSTTDVVWNDNGINVHSCSNVIISKCFFKDFGDNAIEVCSEYNPSLPAAVNSSYIMINNNTFTNVSKAITTTPGGSEDVIVSQNISYNVKGYGIRFYTDIPSISRIIITDNIIKNSIGSGIGIDSCSNVIVSNNVVENTKEEGILLESNGAAITNGHTFANVKLHDNIVRNCGNGILVMNNVYNNGDNRLVQNVEIVNNFIENTVGVSTTADHGAIVVSQNQIKNLKIVSNTINGSADCGIYIGMYVTNLADSDEIRINDNYINNCTNDLIKIERYASTRNYKDIEIARNKCIGSSFDIYDCDHLTISDNSINTSKLSGVTNCNSVNVKNNYFQSSNDGFQFYNNNGLNLSNNYFEALTNALALLGSCKNIIEVNNVYVGPTVLTGAFNTKIGINGNSISFGNAIPSTGSYKKGDIVYNSNPASGKYIGFVCITSGTPGIWKGFGIIQT